MGPYCGPSVRCWSGARDANSAAPITWNASYIASQEMDTRSNSVCAAMPQASAARKILWMTALCPTDILPLKKILYGTVTSGSPLCAGFCAQWGGGALGEMIQGVLVLIFNY